MKKKVKRKVLISILAQSPWCVYFPIAEAENANNNGSISWNESQISE